MLPTTPEMLPVDGSALAEAEFVHRRQLSLDPSDIPARLSLAWCVLLRCLYLAGAESATPMAAASPDSAACRLMTECLKQTSVVLQLSSSETHRFEVEQIRRLLRLAGGGTEVLRQELQDQVVLRTILQELRRTECRRFRRRVSHRRLAG